jgi:uncharacterized membrane protein YedE/YeeE
MSFPTPLQSLVGGLGLSLAVHSFLVLTGASFGVSGFIHNAVRGNAEGAFSVAGLILGGVVVGKLEGDRPQLPSIGLGLTVLAGFLVGFGTRVSAHISTKNLKRLRRIDRFLVRQWLHVWVCDRLVGCDHLRC